MKMPSADEVQIKALRQADLPDFASLMRYRHWRPDNAKPMEVAPEEAEAMFMATQDPRSGCYLWLIWAGQVAVGAVMMMPFFHNTCRHVGYWVAPSQHGKGYASAGLAEVSRIAFNELNAARLQALVQPDNPASLHVLEKNGFAREGLLEKADTKDGIPVDAYLYARVK